MKKRKNESLSCCDTCINLLPVGEGDHICMEFPEPVVILSGYMPTDDYYKCGGKCYEEE